MERTLIYGGIAMFIAELIFIVGISITWTLELVQILGLGFAIIAFNLIAIVLVITGITKR